MDQSGKSMKEVVVFIEGMTCQSCVCNIESHLRKCAGVLFIRVSLNLKFGYVRYDAAKISPAELVGVIDDMGFEAHEDNGSAHITATWLKVEGMTCQSCVQHIQSTVGSLVGIHSVSLSLNEKLATVVHNPSLITGAAIRDAIDDIGFEAELEFPMSDVEDQNNAALPKSNVFTSSQETDEFVELAAARKFASSLLSEAAASDVCKCVISIQGMTCQSCVKNIESNLSDVAGVISIVVFLEQKKADVTFSLSKISAVTIASLIDDMGFDASVMDNGDDNQVIDNVLYGNSLKRSSECSYVTVLSITGMHCKSCTRAIEGHLMGLQGVHSVTVSLENSSCQILHDNSLISADILCQAVEQAGQFTACLLGECVFVLGFLLHFVSSFHLFCWQLLLLGQMFC
jgi:P-type Cu+ transporter